MAQALATAKLLRMPGSESEAEVLRQRVRLARRAMDRAAAGNGPKLRLGKRRRSPESHSAWPGTKTQAEVTVPVTVTDGPGRSAGPHWQWQPGRAAQADSHGHRAATGTVTARVPSDNR